MAASSVSTVRAIRGPQKCFPNLASFQQVDAESEIAFSKKDETFQESQGILSPLRLPVPPRPRRCFITFFWSQAMVFFTRYKMRCGGNVERPLAKAQ
jgi:hypothetical protein